MERPRLKVTFWWTRTPPPHPSLCLYSGGLERHGSYEGREGYPDRAKGCPGSWQNVISRCLWEGVFTGDECLVCGTESSGWPPVGQARSPLRGPAENRELQDGRTCSLRRSQDTAFLLLSDQDSPHRLPRFSASISMCASSCNKPSSRSFSLSSLSVLLPWRTLGTATSEYSADLTVLTQHGDTCWTRAQDPPLAMQQRGLRCGIY